MELNDDGIDRGELHARWFRGPNGELAEVLQTGEILGVPEQLQAWEELGSETEYLTLLRALENEIEDAARGLLVAEAVQRAEDHAALLKVKIPAGAAARLTGHDPDAHTALLADPSQVWNDPRRRTKREAA